jgi:hypothetical protein
MGYWNEKSLQGKEQGWPETKEIAYQWLRAWFFERYEDPNESCPYISAEGGYQYIYGGPYDAHDVFLYSGVWGTIFDEAFLENVVARLTDEADCVEWSGVPTDAWYGEEEDCDAP